MKVAEIMTTEVVTCSTRDSANTAAELMWEHRCGCLPVLAPDGRVVGLVRDRDLCMAAYTQGRPLSAISISTAMPGRFPSCRASAELEEILDLMVAHGEHRVVVLDGEGRLVGLISLGDIAHLAGKWDGGGMVAPAKVSWVVGELGRRADGEGGGAPVPESSSNLSELVRNGLEALKTLGDEIRVELDLASRELRERWHRLEEEVRQVERRAREPRGDGAQSLAAVIESVKRFRNALRKPEGGSADG
jgi:CBS domain-containing protein